MLTHNELTPKMLENDEVRSQYELLRGSEITIVPIS